MKTIRHAMILSPLLFALGCAVTGDDAQESNPQTDDSSSASDSPSDDPTSLPPVFYSATASAAATVIGHKCNVFAATGNSPGDSEAVHCADLAFVQNATGWEIWGVGQALCQALPSSVERCNGIIQHVGVFQAGGHILALANHACGVLSSQMLNFCPGPGTGNGRFQNTSGHVQVERPAPGTCKEIWAAEVSDEFIIPGKNTFVRTGPNVASAHRLFCN